jgi:uncharacterized repeat protein (TIGR01451 family)
MPNATLASLSGANLIANSGASATLSFDACVDPTTAFTGSSSQTIGGSVTWLSATPLWAAVDFSGVTHSNPYLYSPATANTGIDYTGTSASLALAPAGSGTPGFTFGQPVPYTATVTLPEVNPCGPQGATGCTAPGSATTGKTPPAATSAVSTLPAFYACVYLPDNLIVVPAAGVGATNMAMAAPSLTTTTGPSQITVPAGSTATLVTDPTRFADTNCQASSPAANAELDFPAGWTMPFSASPAAGLGTFTQQIDVETAPDVAAAAGQAGSVNPLSATSPPISGVGMTVGLAGRSQTSEATATQAFQIVEPALGFGVSFPNTADSDKVGSIVHSQVSILNAGTSPAYNLGVGVSTPSDSTTAFALGSITAGTVTAAQTGSGSSTGATTSTTVCPTTTTGSATSTTTCSGATSPPPVPTCTPSTVTGAAMWSAAATPPAGYVAGYSSTGPLGPGDCEIFSFSFTIQDGVPNGAQLPVTATLLQATSQPGLDNPPTPPSTGRVYASATTANPSPAHPVPAVSAAITVIGPVVDLVTTITAPAASVAPGSTPTFTVTVTNKGPDPIAQMDLSVSSNPALSNALVQAASGQGTYSQATGLWAVALAAGQSATAHISGQVPATAKGSLTVTATAAVGSGVSDPTPADGRASVTVALQSAVNVSVAVVQQGPLYSGQAGVYVVTVTNAGPSTANAITLTDTMPPGTGLLNATGGGWVCGTSYPLTCNFAGPLAAGASTKVTIDAVIDSATGSRVTNTASVATPSNGAPPSQTTASVTGVVQPSLINGSGASTATGSSAGSATAPAAAVSAPATSSTKALAFTGAPSAPEARAAFAFLLAGVVLVAASRRRRRLSGALHTKKRSTP